MRKYGDFYRLFAFSAWLLVAACTAGDEMAPLKAIQSAPAGNGLAVTLANTEGVVKTGKQSFTLTFNDAAGKPVDVGSAALRFQMPSMGAMSAMNITATLVSTGTPGVYRGDVELQMGGQWQAQVIYEGAAGSGRAALPVTVQ